MVEEVWRFRMHSVVKNESSYSFHHVCHICMWLCISVNSCHYNKSDQVAWTTDTEFLQFWGPDVWDGGVSMVVLWQVISSSCSSEQRKEVNSLFFLQKVLIQVWELCSHSPNTCHIYMWHINIWGKKTHNSAYAIHLREKMKCWLVYKSKS